MNEKPSFRVVIASPGGRTAGGGMGSVARYIQDEFRSAHPDVDCRVVDARGTGSALMSLLYTTVTAVKLIAWRFQPEPLVLHLNVSERMSFFRKGALGFLGRLLGIPVVLHHHGAEFAGFIESTSSLSQWWCRKVVRAARINIVLGQEWLAILRDRMGVPAEQIMVLYNAVPDSFGPGLAAKKTVAGISQPLRLLTLANLSDRKGIPELLKALAQTRKDGLALFAQIVGGGEVERFKAQARDLGLDEVCEIPGWVDAGRVPGFLAENDLFVLPSFNEGLPMAILESLSAGVPVITTPVGSLPEVLADRQTCLFVPPGNVEALVAAIETIREDRDLYAHLSEAGRDLFEKTFHITGYVQRLRAIYQATLGIGKDRVTNKPSRHP